MSPVTVSSASPSHPQAGARLRASVLSSEAAPHRPLSPHLEPLHVDDPPPQPLVRSHGPAPLQGPRPLEWSPHPTHGPLQAPSSLRDPCGPHSQAPGQGSPCFLFSPPPKLPPRLQSQRSHLEVLTPSPPGCQDPQSSSPYLRRDSSQVSTCLLALTDGGGQHPEPRVEKRSKAATAGPATCVGGRREREETTGCRLSVPGSP